LEVNEKNLTKSRYIRGSGLVFQSIGENRYYYLTNAHGDTLRQVDQNGNLTPEYIYDSFGNQYGLEETTYVKRLADPNPFRYSGQYYDIDTKEYYLRTRRYDPGTGRFTSEDPISSDSSLYTYCGNNPVTRTDPSGLRYVEGITIGDTNRTTTTTKAASGVPGISLDAAGPVIKPLHNIHQL
jgi:RHS repeat-associated protein